MLQGGELFGGQGLDIDLGQLIMGQLVMAKRVLAQVILAESGDVRRGEQGGGGALLGEDILELEAPLEHADLVAVFARRGVIVLRDLLARGVLN